MIRDVIVFGSECGAGAACGLLQTAAKGPGVRIAQPWTDWHPVAGSRSTAVPVFVVLAVGRCGDGGDDLSRWWLEFLERTATAPIMRVAPIILLSTHLSKLVGDLRESTGFDLSVEPGILGGELDHRLAEASGALCELPAIQEELRRLLGRVALDDHALEPAAAASLVPDVNLEQAVRLLRAAARHLHNDLHTLRSPGRLLGEAQGPGQGPRERLTALKRRLNLVASPPRVSAFIELGVEKLAELQSREEQFETAAAYLEQSAALLKWEQLVARRRLRASTVVVIVDDDEPSALALNEALQGNDEYECKVVSLPVEGVTSAAQRARRCGGDPSRAVADVVWNAVAEELSRLYARSRWVCDRTEFVLVVDIRLTPEGPESGLWLIRRARDQYPFLRTIAVTVRRGLGDDLLDEAVDAYVAKVGSERAVNEEVVDAVRTLTDGGTFSLFPGTEWVLDDPRFAALVSTMHRLRPVSPGSPGARLVVTPPQSAYAAARDVTERGVVAVILEKPEQIASQFRLTRLLREHGVQTLLMGAMTSARKGAGSLLPTSILDLDRALHSGLAVQHHVRWSLLVPKSANWGGIPVVSRERDLAQIRAEVSARFGGATGSDARGIWLRSIDNMLVKDDLEAIQVWARSTTAGRHHMLELANDVVQSFSQDEVFLVEEQIRSWSVVAQEILPSGVLADERSRVDVSFAYTSTE